MEKPAIPLTEEERLAVLRSLNVLDSQPEERFDRVTRLLARLLDVPIALVSLVDAHRQWFKSRVGLEATETPRELSFCGHAILGDEPLVVSDATTDQRFCDNPLVVTPPGIRFYVGQPLVGPRGMKLGTLCAIDRKPRLVTAAEQLLLRDLAAIVERELSLTDLVALQQQVITAQEVADKLLLCILPAPIAERLKHAQHFIAENFAEASILFADIYEFSRLTHGVAPEQVVALLNAIFNVFDRLAQTHGAERIKTVGDAYMMAAGLPLPRADHAEVVADIALAMQREMSQFHAPNGEFFCLRIGVATGPVVAGVVGATKFAYDLWGQTVRAASQMESFGLPGCIQITEATRAKLGDHYLVEPRGEFYVKGVGDVKTFLLCGKKTGAR